MGEKVLLDIAILTRDRPDYIILPLSGLLSQGYSGLTLSIYDNGKTEFSAPAKALMQLLVSGYNWAVRHFKVKEHILLRLRQLALENTKAQYLFLLDDDSFPMPNVVTECLTGFNKNHNVGCISPCYVDYENVREYHGYTLDFQDSPQSAPVGVRGFQRYTFSSEEDRFVDVRDGAGGCAFYSVEVMNCIGGFLSTDWETCLSEDTLTFRQIERYGYKKLLATRAIVYHFPTSTFLNLGYIRENLHKDIQNGMFDSLLR